MSKPTNTKRRALLILGMHRSGTSAVTRVVNLLGATIGDRLVPPGHDNPSGFWENATAVGINEQLLRELGRTWYDTREMPDGWMETAAAAKALDLAIKFIRRDLGSSALCALKDPRICLTAPLWIKAFEMLKFEVSCLFVARDPREVVESLHRRNDWPRAPLYLMWVQYLLEAEAATRQYRRVMVSYDQVLGDWRACMERVAKELHLAWPVKLDDAATAVEAFLDQGQRHHRKTDRTVADDDDVPELVRSLYAASLETTKGEPEWDAIARLRANFRRVAELYAERVDTVLAERWNAEARAQTAESELVERASLEQVFQQATQESHAAWEGRLARLDEHVASVEKLVQSEGAERASLEQIFQQTMQESRAALEGRLARLAEHVASVEKLVQSEGAERVSLGQAFQQTTQESRAALEGRLARLAEHVASVEKLVQTESAEGAARWNGQASLVAGTQEALRLSHESIEARIGGVEQNLMGVVQEARQEVGELQGRILRHQEALQTVEARLQRQYALLNTVLLSLEQVAGDRLADKISVLTGKVDAMHGAEVQTLRQDLENNNARLAGLLGSTSWRLTRPLRWMSAHLLRRPPANE